MDQKKTESPERTEERFPFNAINSEGFAESVLNKLQTALNVDSLKDVAEAIGLTPSGLYHRKSQNRIPFKNIIECCLANNISLDSVFAKERELSGDLAIDIGFEAIRLQLMRPSIGAGLPKTAAKHQKLSEVLNLPSNSAVRLVYVNKSDAFPSVCAFGDPVLIAQIELKDGESLNPEHILDGDILLLILDNQLVLRRVFKTLEGLSLSTERGQGSVTLSWSDIGQKLFVIGKLEHTLHSYGSGHDNIDKLLEAERRERVDASTLVKMPSSKDLFMSFQEMTND